MVIIKTENLTKKFGDVLAVDNISITVGSGEIYGFLGLNGAGKTTTIRLLLGMIKQNSGSKKLFGREVEPTSGIWNDVGYLVESPHSYPDLTVRENLELIYKLRGLKDKKLVGQIINKLNLFQYADRKARHLSTGNNQRLGLAKALMHSPKLLILDEPINGLDPAGIVEIRELLKELVLSQDTTIFLSSHILSEISKLATRIGIVHNGILIKEITTDELEEQIIRKLRVGTVDNERALQLLIDQGIAASLNGETSIEINELKYIEQPEIIATLLVNSEQPPRRLEVVEEDLETYFLRIIEEESG